MKSAGRQSESDEAISSRILVVDDDEPLRALLEEILLTANYSVSTAANGHQALQCLEQQSFDLIITDLVTPDLDGTELIRRIRANQPTLPIVAVSGAGRDANLYLRIAEKLGASASLSKPFRMRTVLDTVADCLGQSETPAST